MRSGVFFAKRNPPSCASGFGFHFYLAIEKSPSVEATSELNSGMRCSRPCGAVPQIKLMVAFDTDVDVTDDSAVLQALARRFQAVDPLTGESRILDLPRMKAASYDPSSFHREYPTRS